MKLSKFGAVAASIVLVCVGSAQSTQTGSTLGSDAGAKPLLLEKDEGEQRLWRPEPGAVGDQGGFNLKVTPKSNGSKHLVLMTEDLIPGDAIPMHKHLEQDEIVLIEKGIVHAHVGDHERDLHAGGMAFIPARTWVSFKNTGKETVSLGHIFGAGLRGTSSVRIGGGGRKADDYFPSKRTRM